MGASEDISCSHRDHGQRLAPVRGRRRFQQVTHERQELLSPRQSVPSTHGDSMNEER
jgi:hypothetical protein